MTDTPTSMLRAEHRLILEVTDVLDAILQSEVESGWLDLDSVTDCVSFFRLYVDACHHGKEESLLFPELEEHGLEHDSGPIAVMLAEHQLGRAFVARMAGAVDGARQGDQQARATLLDAARGYVELIRGHIGKEDGALFNLADEIVPGPACRRLCDEYVALCQRHFEGKTLQELESLASELATRLGTN